MPPVVESQKRVFAPIIDQPFRLSPESILEARKPLDAMVEKNATHLFSLQTQLGAYLILGNGIALFTLSRALIENELAANAWANAVYLRFMWGLAVAFAAMAATYFFGLFGSYVLGLQSQYLLMIADADKQALGAAEANAKRKATAALHSTSQLLDRHQRKISWMFAGIVLILGVYIISGALFVWGLAGALHLATP